MGSSGSHAVVIGASMGGLLAARALAGPYSRVTLLDRDELPTDSANRKGVPQGKHVHVLLARGAQVLDAMFPGLLDELEAHGSTVIRTFEPVHFSTGGHTFVMPTKPADPPVYLTARPFLESRIRARIRALPGVGVLDRAEATGLLSSPGGGRVTGVRMRRAGVESELAADLVVDATGRTGRAPVWLQELGYSPAAEDRLDIDLMYGTRHTETADGSVNGIRLALIAPYPDNPRGMAFTTVEDGHVVVTVAGYAGDHPPTDDTGFDAYVASIAPPALADAIIAGRSRGPVVTHRYPSNLRRRYEKLDRFPAGFLVFGDAFCSFNPLYGQGMTVSALQAEALRACLVRGGRSTDDLARRFFKAAAKPVGVAWDTALGEDLSLPQVEGDRSARVRVANAFVGRVKAASAHDEVVSEAFLRVINVLEPPTSLFAPAILRRVLRGSAPPVDPPGPVAAPPAEAPELPALQGVECF
jgi:2-polyprenyl-6-methoxyphenol hydroxylase-like FAD-dependent oxidoreductase